MTVVIPTELPATLARLLERRFSEDAQVAADARYAFANETKGLVLDEVEARALIDFAVSPTLPAPAREWEDTAADALMLLWAARPEVKEALVPKVRDVYPGARDSLRLALLTQLAATHTRAAAEALGALVEAHGFPERPHQRLFRELYGHLDRADVLFPALFERAGHSKIEVGNVLLAALSSKKLAPVTLRALAPSIVRSLDDAVTAARAFEQDAGVAWRFEEAYEPSRSAAGFFADLAGFLEKDDAAAALERAARSRDPWIAVFAVTSLLRLGVAVDDDRIERVAASHETRAILYGQLERLSLVARFPWAHSTLDAFAAADMVQWLKYPTELGREPDVLEKMATFDAHREGGPVVLYVWRFSDHEGRLCAAVSGPYPRDGVPGPVSGASTFSRFERWETATAAEHAQAVLDTLREWHESWEKQGASEAL